MSRQPGPAGFGRRMGILRVALGSRGQFTTRGRFSSDLGVSRARYLNWENKNQFPGRPFLASCLAKLPSVQQRKLDPERLALWADIGPDDQPPFDPSFSLASPDPASQPASVDADADIIRFDDLVEQVGYLAQKRVYEAAVSGEKIPENFVELVRAALNLREVAIKTPASPELRDARAATAQAGQERRDSGSVAA